jgi:pyruvate dehydrogenase E1 component alpha subunit
MAVANESLVRIYTNMVRSRLLDQKFVELSLAKTLITPWHSGEGEEGVCAVYSLLEHGDICGYTHRGCYAWVCRGIPMGEQIAEFLGKATGSAKGKGATHITSLPHGVLGRSGMQGGHFSLYAGSAIAAQVLGKNTVSVCSFGEGAATSGILHESMVYASRNKLPVLYLCENNGFDTFMRTDEVWPQTDIAKMGIPYDIPFTILDGNDALAVADAADEALARVRGGEGPHILELKTYRIRAHYEIPEPPYRTQEEIESWRQRDPIPRMENALLEREIISRADVERIYAAARSEVADAERFALKSPDPEPQEAYTDVYAD